MHSSLKSDTDRATRDVLVAKYKEGYAEVARALEGASDTFLCARCAAEQVAVADEPEAP